MPTGQWSRDRALHCVYFPGHIALAGTPVIERFFAPCLLMSFCVHAAERNRLPRQCQSSASQTQAPLPRPVAFHKRWSISMFAAAGESRDRMFQQPGIGRTRTIELTGGR